MHVMQAAAAAMLLIVAINADFKKHKILLT